jgi:aspartyl/asparaginyl beta-hydroxylase (cupin superfamily)
VKRRVRKNAKFFIKRALRPALNRFLIQYSRVGDPVVFDSSLFPWVQTLEENFDQIRDEAIKLSALKDWLPTFQQVSPYQQRIAEGDEWKMVYLYAFGESAETAGELCPVTSRLLERVPDLESACFSLLEPGAHVAAHRGLYKGLINYHLGVLVPKDSRNCRMRLADETIVWQSGESCLFDDTNLHEVWNDTEEVRVVLFLQVHRDLSPPGRQVSRLFLRILRWTPYLRVAMKNGRELDSELREVALERGFVRGDPA